MSAPAENAPTGIAPLVGRRNYKHWAQDFQVAAQRQGFWRLYVGEEQIKQKPDPADYQSEILKAKTAFMASYWQHRFDSDMWEWEEQQKKIEAALAFIVENVHPVIRSHAQQYDVPEHVWQALRYAYEEPDLTPSDLAYQNMVDLHLKDCHDVTDYFNRLHAFAADIMSAGGGFTESQCKVKILTSITAEYAPPIIANLTMHMLTDMDLDQWEAYLLAWEAELARQREHSWPEANMHGFCS